MMTNQQPIIILKEGTERTKGKEALNNNIMAARAIADTVRSTLGPMGMDKMLVDTMGDVVITNDGATILKEMDIEHPAAKMIVEVSKTQDSECGDGTTSAAVLAGELLKYAEELIGQEVHPTTIVNGYQMAAIKGKELLDKIATKITPTDKDVLNKVASTALTGKSAEMATDIIVSMVVDACTRVAEKKGDKYEVDPDDIIIVKKEGASLNESLLIAGIVMDKEIVHPNMPKSIKNAKVALIDAALEIEKTETDAKIQISSPEQLQKFLDEEEHMIKEMVEAIKKSGATVVLCQKGIDDLAQHYLAKSGIAASRRIKKSDMEKLAKATGATIVSNLKDLSADELGTAGLVEERKVGDDDMIYVTECPSSKAVTLLLRGGTEHVVAEVERAAHDAIRVTEVAIEDGAVVAGGGSPEIELSLRLREYAPQAGGREQLAIEAFAKALEIIPKSLAENAGLDPIDSLVGLRAAHEKGGVAMGLDTETGKPVDMMEKSVIEPLRVKSQAIKSAGEAAILILRVDDVIAAKQAAGGAPPGGMPDMDY